MLIPKLLATSKTSMAIKILSLTIILSLRKCELYRIWVLMVIALRLIITEFHCINVIEPLLLPLHEKTSEEVSLTAKIECNNYYSIIIHKNGELLDSKAYSLKYSILRAPNLPVTHT